MLVDDLGPTTVNLRVYIWIDGSEFSWLKVKLSVTQLVKRALQNQQITLPDGLATLFSREKFPCESLRFVSRLLRTTKLL